MYTFYIITKCISSFKSVHDGFPPSENHLRIEKLVARVVCPYLGVFGYYEGSPTPTNEVQLRPSTKPKVAGNFFKYFKAYYKIIIELCF